MSIGETVGNIAEWVENYVWLGIPGIAQGFIVALVFVAIFRKQIKKHPNIFYIYPALYFFYELAYIIAMSATNYELYFTLGGESSLLANLAHWLGHIGFGTTFGIGLIVIVMFIGVLPKTTLVKNLFAIRTEMSIIGATILAGHAVVYVSTIVSTPIRSTENALMYWILGPILTALLLLPWITSFRTVRKRMKAGVWKKLQTYTSVPMFVIMLAFGIVYALRTLNDVPGYVVPDAWAVKVNPWSADEPISLGEGAQYASAILAIKIYAFLLVSYIVLRIKKVRNASHPAADLPASRLDRFADKA
jgi:DMSO/TMAO reductase YedYZ heme-binding membrane subunit